MRPDPLTSAMEELERALSGVEDALERLAELLEEPPRPRAEPSPGKRPAFELVQGGGPWACHD